MKNILFTASWFLLILSLGGTFGTRGVAWSAIEDLDSIVAVVNNDVILRSELNTQIESIQAQLATKGTRLPPSRVLEQQVLDQLINNRLQLQTAEQSGISVDDTTLAQAIGTIAERNNMSLAKLRDTLEMDGISFVNFREETRQQIIASRLRNQQVLSRIVVTDQEVENFLENEAANLNKRSEVHLFHILIATSEGASADAIQTAKQKAEKILEELRAGADFQELAVTYSQGRQALDGGDLGWRKISEIPTLAVALANSLERGEFSEPVRSASGFHILLLADYRGGDRYIVTQTLARHILIKPSELVSDDEARIRLEQLRFRLINGEDFANLARSHSDDTASGIKGGDLGWVNPGDLVPKFEEQMDALAIQDISQPFRTQFGWHVVQVLERRSHDNTDAALKAKAREALRIRKGEEATLLWRQRMRDEAYVEIRLDK